MPDDPGKNIPRALSGLRVLALEVSVAGPHATRILGDMGAEIIKIEKPGTGDLIRNWDSAVRGLSSGYVWLNGNKRSLAIDTKKKAGLEAVLRLAEKVDVVLRFVDRKRMAEHGSAFDIERGIVGHHAAK